MLENKKVPKYSFHVCINYKAMKRVLAISCSTRLDVSFGISRIFCLCSTKEEKMDQWRIKDGSDPGAKYFVEGFFGGRKKVSALRKILAN